MGWMKDASVTKDNCEREIRKRTEQMEMEIQKRTFDIGKSNRMSRFERLKFLERRVASIKSFMHKVNQIIWKCSSDNYISTKETKKCHTFFLDHVQDQIKSWNELVRLNVWQTKAVVQILIRDHRAEPVVEGHQAWEGN